MIERRTNGDLHRFDLQMDTAFIIGAGGPQIEVIENRQPDLRRQSLTVRRNLMQFDVAVRLADRRYPVGAMLREVASCNAPPAAREAATIFCASSPR